MFTTSLHSMFNAFNSINKISGIESISEISVHRNQVSFLFESKNIIYLKNIYDIEERIDPIKIDDITLFENTLIASTRDLSELDITKEDFSNPLCLFKAVIEELVEVICACPVLEFVISSSYIKCYLDKPNIPLEDVAKLDAIFGGKGILELKGQRPYVLYIKEDTEMKQNGS